MDTLSSELVIQIFCFLDLKGLFACRLTCRRFSDIYRASAYLQHINQLEAAGLEEHDPDGQRLSIIERAHLLKAREDAWQTASFARINSFSVPKNYDCFKIDIGGHIVLADDVSGAFKSLRLPSLTTPSLTAESTYGSIIDQQANPFETSPIPHVITVVFSEEQDLMVSITLRATPQMTILTLQFFRFSTLEPHPHADRHEIHLFFLGLDYRSATSMFVPAGIHEDKVVFAIPSLTERRAEDAFHMDYYCLMWSCGFIFELRTVESCSFSTITFLTSELLLIPLIKEGRFEICRLVVPTAPGSLLLETVVFLELPNLGADVYFFAPEALEMGPDLSSERTQTLTQPHTRFRSSALNAILAFQIYLQSWPSSYSDLTASFICVVHRSTLIEHARSILADPSVVLRQAAPIPDGRVFSTDTALVLPMMLQPDPSRLSQVPASLTWQEWHGNATFWLQTSPNALPSWTTCGQRLILSHDMENPLQILDFNPANVRYARSRYAPDGDAHILPNGNSLRVVHSPRPLDVAGWFKDPVVSSLPYLETTMKQGDLQWYHELLADDDRIIGIIDKRLDDEESTEQIRFDILHTS